MRSVSYYVLLLLAISCWIACNSVEQANKQTTETSCYLAVMVKDSFSLSITIKEGKASGKLRYKFFEKDSSTGDFEGVMRGDTLIATYTFVSEGIESVSEVAFLRRGDQWQEGYGPTEEKNGKTVFTSRKDIDFSDGIMLKKVACK